MRNRRRPINAARSLRQTRQLALLLALLTMGALPDISRAAEGVSEQPDTVFHRFTRHIQDYIASDKVAFAQASGCTNWFYRQEKDKPPPFEAHPIRLEPALQPPGRDECLRLYPGGLDAVRQDFQRTQTSLSVSLTSYEFALVVDQDDDGRYSREELSDLFQVLALTYDPAHSPTTQATALTERFDTWYRARTLDYVMSGMSQLYDKGYRVTPADRAELDRVTR